MRINIFFTVLLSIIGTNVSSQQIHNIDSTRALYLYEFVTNHYLSNVDFWSSRANVQGKYNISDNYIMLSNNIISSKELDSLLIYFSFDTSGKYLDIINKFDLNSINTQFKTVVKSNKSNLPDSLLCPQNCRAYIRFSDVFIYDNRYYIAVIGKANMYGLAFFLDDILYEFEICEKNGFINFIAYTRYMGRSEEDFKNNTFESCKKEFKDYFPCGYED